MEAQNIVNLATIEAHKLYSTLSDNASLTSHLRLILSNRAQLEALSQRSYRHENGHCKLMLYYADRKSPAVRLHIWDSSEGEADIHSHAWGFRSRVVEGSLVNLIYDKGELPDSGSEMFEYAVQLGDRRHTGHHLHCHGRVFIRETGRYYLPPGSQYGFAAGIIHQVCPSEEGAISVFLQQPFQREESRLFRTEEQSSASISVSLLSEVKIAAVLEQAIDRITNSALIEATGKRA